MTEPQAVEALKMSDLTFEEAELLENALDMSIETIRDRLQGDKPKMKIIRALKWLELRRGDPELAMADTASMSIMSAFAESDPKASDEPSDEPSETESTQPSASSTDS